MLRPTLALACAWEPPRREADDEYHDGDGQRLGLGYVVLPLGSEGLSFNQTVSLYVSIAAPPAAVTERTRAATSFGVSLTISAAMRCASSVRRASSVTGGYAQSGRVSYHSSCAAGISAIGR